MTKCEPRAFAGSPFDPQRPSTPGIARDLMQVVDRFAVANSRRLLVLDTIAGSPAESLYQHLGWQKSGEIPNYAAMPDGELRPTAVYYRLL